MCDLSKVDELVKVSCWAPGAVAEWQCSSSSHRRHQLMMPFLTGTGLERVGVVRPDLDRCWTNPQAVRHRAWDMTVAALIGRF